MDWSASEFVLGDARCEERSMFPSLHPEPEPERYRGRPLLIVLEN